ncbi:flavodoxin family protein [Bradyrhizobium sp. NC92]|uniref:flavodoxin family protein n=1 Tax=Bradyrhizobium sp. (strain NC92) TaxID=55395 RepID=UPI0021A98BF5|nr:flavodoxin family protein [Bradyrhizobium sp. NC92]UWU66003.1 flavodoxin family protein [Bradyrhizobium sp. NC92]
MAKFPKVAAMPLLAIIYFSITGTTEKLAHAVARGADGIADVARCRITGNDIMSGRFQNESFLETIDHASAVAFGSPTYMGGPAAQFKAFADASSDRWSQQRWANKIAAGFTTGACVSGDQLHTLTYFTILAALHGMLWCGLDVPGGEDPTGRNRLGSQLGLATNIIDGALPHSDLTTAEYLGQRLAKLAKSNG